MAYTPINLGTAPTGSDGDPVRAAFVKVNYLLSDMASGNAGTPNFALSDVAANWRGIRWATSGSTRFDMVISGGAETGSNANSNLYLRRSDDKGSFVSDVFNVNRATGLMTFTSPIALLGALNSSAKVNAINAANQVINGSGELGDAGWNTANFVSQKMGGSFANGQFCFKNAAALSADTYDFQPTIPCAAGVPLCLQAEMATWGMTKGSVVCGVNFLNSSGTQVGNLFVTSNGYGNDFAYATATGVAPAGTVSIQPFKGAWGTPAVTAGGCAVRRIKVEKGTQPSLYSQEASIAYLQGSPALSGRPTFAGKTPWDSGNLTPSNYAALSGAAYSGPVSVSTTANATKLGINGWGDNHGFGIAMQPASGVYTGSAILFSNPDGYTSGSISLVTDHVVYNTTSDYRLKTVVGDAKGALDVVRDTPVHRYTRKSGDGTVYVGFLAHELQERVPYAVHGEKDARREMEVRGDLGEVVGTRVVDDYQMVDYPSLTGMLWAALQEAIARIEALEARE